MEWKGLWNYVENLIPGKSRSQESVDRGDSNSQDSEDSQDTPPSPCRGGARRYPVMSARRGAGGKRASDSEEDEEEFEDSEDGNERDEGEEEEAGARAKAVADEEVDEDEDEEGDIDGDGVSSSPSDSSDFEDSEGVDTEIENNTVSENSDGGKKGSGASTPASTSSFTTNPSSGSTNLSSSSTSGSTDSTSSSTSSGSEENSADEEGRDGSESPESSAGNHETKLEESKASDKSGDKNIERKPNGEVPQHDHSDSDGDRECSEKTCKDPSLASEKDLSIASEKGPSLDSEKAPSLSSKKDPSLDSEKGEGQEETEAEGEGTWETSEGEDPMENPKDAKTSVNVAILTASRRRKKDEARKECRQADVRGKIRSLEECKVEASGTTQEETESTANGKREKTDNDGVGKNRRRRRGRGEDMEVEDKNGGKVLEKEGGAEEKTATDAGNEDGDEENAKNNETEETNEGKEVETDTVKESATKSTDEDKDKNTCKKVTCRRADSKKGRGRGKLDKGRSQWLVSTEQAERGGSREYDRRMEVATSENSCGEEEATKCGKNERCGQESRAGRTETPPAGEESQADSGKERSADPDGGEARRETEENETRGERPQSENSDNDEDFSAEEARARGEGEAHEKDGDNRPARRTYDRLNARFSDIAKKIMKEVQESRSEYRRPQPKPRSFRRTWEEKADGASRVTHTIEETTSRILEVSSGSRSSSLTTKEILVRPASGDSETRISVSSSRDTYDPFYHDRTTRKYSKFSDSTSRFTRSSAVPRDTSGSREGSSETLLSCMKGSKLLKAQDDDSARGSTSEGEGDSPRTTEGEGDSPRTTERVRKLSVTFQNDAKSPPPPTSSSSSEALLEEQGAGGRSIVTSSSVTRGNVEPEPGDPKSSVAADICTSSRGADVVEHLAVTSGDVTEPVDDVTNNNKRTRIYSRSSSASHDSRTPSRETLENAVNENKENGESKTESERNCAEVKGRGEGRRSESRARPREQDRPVGRSSSEDDVDQDSLEGPWATPQLAKVVQELVVSRKFSMTTAQVKKRQQNLGRLDVSQKDRTVIFDSSRFPRNGSDKDSDPRQEREAAKGDAQEEAKGAPKWSGRARSNGRNGVAWQPTARKGRRRKSIEGDGSQSEASTDSHAPGEESAATQEGRRHFTKHSCVKVSKTETKRSGGGGPRGKYLAWANENHKGDSRGAGNKDESKVMPSPRIERMCRSPQLHKGRMFSSHRRDSSSSRTSPRQSPIGSRYQSPPGAVSPRLGSSSRVGSPRPDSPRIGSSRSASPRRMSPRVSPRIGLRSSPTKFVTSRTSPIPASPRIVKPIVTYGCQRSPRSTSTFDRQRSLSVDKMRNGRAPDFLQKIRANKENAKTAKDGSPPSTSPVEKRDPGRAVRETMKEGKEILFCAKDNLNDAEDGATSPGEETLGSIATGTPKPLKALRREMSDCRQRLESFVESRAMQEQRQQRYILITSKMSGKLDSEIIQFFESQQQKPREILRNEKVLHEHFRAGSKSDLRRASGSSFRSKSASTEGDKSSEDAKEGSEDDATPEATHDVSFTRDVTRDAFPFLAKAAKELSEEEGTEEDSGRRRSRPGTEGKREGREKLKSQPKVIEKEETERKSLPVEEEAKERNSHLYDTVADDKSDDAATALPSRDETCNHASITDHTGSVNTIPDDGNLSPGQGKDTIAGGENKEEEVEEEEATAGGELDKDVTNRGDTGKREESMNEDDTNEEGGSDEKSGEILTKALSTTSLETAAFEEEERGILEDEKVDVETRVKICEETLISRTDNVLVNESVREERRYEEGPAKVKKGIVKEIIMQKEEEAKSKIEETHKAQQGMRGDISPTSPKGKDETPQDDAGTKVDAAPRKPDADGHPRASPGLASNRDAAATNAAVGEGEGEDVSVGSKESPAGVRRFSRRGDSSMNLASQRTPLEPSAEEKSERKDAQAEGTVRSPLLRRTVQSKETRTVEFNFVKGKGLVREERVVFRGARDLQEDVSNEASVGDKQMEASQPKEETKEDAEGQDAEEQSAEELDQNETLTAEDERHDEVAVSEEDGREDVVEAVVTKTETSGGEDVEVPHNTETRGSDEQVPEHMYANILPPPARVIRDEPKEVTAPPREEEMEDQRVPNRTTTARRLMSGHRRLTKTISEGSFVAADEASGTERSRPPSIRRSRTESEFLTDQLAAAATSSAEHKSAVSHIFTRGVSGKVRMKSRSVENIRLSSLSCVEITNPIDSAPLPKSSSACRIVGVLKKKDSRENVLELMSPSKNDEHEDEGEAEPQDNIETTKEEGREEEKNEDQAEVLSDLKLSNDDNLPVEESPVEEAIPSLSSEENIKNEVLEPIETEVIQPIEDLPEEFPTPQDNSKGTNMSVISSAPIDSHIYENVPDVLFCRSGTAEVPTQFMDHELEHTSTPIDHSRKLVAKVVHIYENLPPPGVLLETSFGDVGNMGEFLPLQDVCVSKENTYEECVANEQRDSEPKFIDLKTAESSILSPRIMESNTVEPKITELRSEARVIETIEPPMTPVVTGKPPKPSSDALSVRRPTYEKASLRRKQPESESRVEKQKSNYMRQKGVRVGILKKQKSDITGVRLQKLHYFDSELPGERRRSYSIGGDPRKGSKHGKGDADKEQASHTSESSHDLDTSEASRPEMRDLDRRCHSSISASSNTSKSSRIDRILQSCAPCISSNTSSMLDLSVRSGVHTIGEESGDEDDDTYRGQISPPRQKAAEQVAPPRGME
nr:uncharacterized protein LOC113805965 [Penaeus vannamei]